MGNTVTEFPKCSGELPVRSKKAVLRDLQNDNIVTIPNSIGHPPFLKDRETSFETSEPIKVSSTKRMSSEYPMNPNNHQSSSNNAANGHLVYVRRKSEAEQTKSVSCETTNVGSHGLRARQLVQDDTSETQPKIKEPKISCFSAFVPLPVAPMHSSKKPSVPPVPGHTAMRLEPTDLNFPTAASVPPLGNPKSSQNLHWEDRYFQLQTSLRKIDLSDQEEYVQMLWSLSSVELNRHAIELEKRSIQLSLEEAKELKCVGALNLLRKPINAKLPADQE